MGRRTRRPRGKASSAANNAQHELASYVAGTLERLASSTGAPQQACVFTQVLASSSSDQGRRNAAGSQSASSGVGSDSQDLFFPALPLQGHSYHTWASANQRVPRWEMQAASMPTMSASQGATGSKPMVPPGNSKHYEKIEECGKGAFGTVYKGLDRQNGTLVAMKRLNRPDDDLGDGIPAALLREISILRDLVHPNVVRLLDLVSDGPLDYTLIFEFVGDDLSQHIQRIRKAGTLMPLGQVVTYARDLLAGVFACHSRLVVHRDLKPQNILVSSDGSSLKICDFGLGRMFSAPNKPYTPNVVTLWYRAPEVLLGSPSYGFDVDTWSLGCTIAEMATNLPTFPGNSEIGTILKIFQSLGTPTEETWPEVTRLRFWQPCFPKWNPTTTLQNVLEARPGLGEHGGHLLRGLLTLSPDVRLSARAARNHAFFTRNTAAPTTSSPEPPSQ